MEQSEARLVRAHGRARVSVCGCSADREGARARMMKEVLVGGNFVESVLMVQ